MAEVKTVIKPAKFNGKLPKPEDFGGPKKPALGPYFLWCGTARAAIMQELREKCEKEGTAFKVTEVAVKMAEAYKKSVSEEKKAELSAESEIIKAKFAEEMEAWKKMPQYEEYLKVKSNTKEKVEMKKAKKEIKENGMPSKPPSGYMLFAASRREAVIAEMRGKSVTPTIQAVGGVISKEWKELGDEKKEPFAMEAKAKKEQFDKEMEAFKLTDTYKTFQSTTAQIKSGQTKKQYDQDEKKKAKEAAAAAKKIYIAQSPINMTSELALESAVIRSIAANEKIQSIAEPSEDGEITRVKCIALKDKAEGFVTIKEGETEYLTVQEAKKPRKKTETVSEVEGDEETAESEEAPKKERKKRVTKPKTEGEEKGAKKARADAPKTEPKTEAAVEKEATVEVAA